MATKSAPPKSSKSEPQAAAQSLPNGTKLEHKSYTDEEWDETRYSAAVRKVSELQEKISTLRLITPDLVRTLANVPLMMAGPDTGLPSPPGSPVLRGVDDDGHDAGSPLAVYQHFEGRATQVATLVKEIREAWASDDVKKIMERCEKRADMQELEQGWDIVVGRPRWMVTDEDSSLKSGDSEWQDVGMTDV